VSTLDLGPITEATIIVGFISVVPVVFAGSLNLYKYFKSRRRFDLITSLPFFFYALYLLGITLSYLFVSLGPFLFGCAAIIPTLFSFISFLDSISRESVDPIKLVIGTFLSTIFVVSLLMPNSTYFYYSSGALFIFWSDFFVITSFGIFMYTSLLLLFYFTKVLMNAPKELKE